RIVRRLPACPRHQATCSQVGWLVFAVALLLAAPSTGRAHPGDLDPSFGTGGIVTTSFGTAVVNAGGIALQADGKIVAVGSAGAPSAFALARYNPNGNLDTSFGTGGTMTTSFGAGSAAAAVALQGDGKIVAAGSTDTGIENIF